MRPIEDLRDRGNGPLVVSLTGDGEREKEILKALAQRHNGHDKALLLPTKNPAIGVERKKIGRFSGPSAFQVVKTFVSKFGFSRYLVILDIEHFGENRTQEGLQNQIAGSLSCFGFADQSITPLNDRSYRVTCTVGTRRVCMNTVLSGSNKCVEENISELLRLEHGLNVSPTKPAVREALRQLDLHLRDLLTGCRACNLSRAFPGLVAALQDLESAPLA